ncbi:MAG: right-handed parallel beta-helix repeat-containing protein, partial [Bacteroidetes bacterium]|nr:right-handed parallel beta-helix repeat-containing protein [Bacteroidota bacterium]
MYKLVISLLFSLAGLSALAQKNNCGCDHIIGPEMSYIRATDMPQVKPGDVVCIQAGVRGRLAFVGFEGTAEQPIIFKNCGGQVILDQAELDGSLVFQKSRYFHVTGTGSPNHKYGFLIRKAKGSAISLTDTDFEIDHVEVADAGFAGIFTKHEALCDNEPYHRGNFVMKNISIHDNYIHDTHGEGMYIGSSWWKGKKNKCGILYPPEIHGLRVYNNTIEDTGADGLQIGCAAKDVEVYNNIIRRYGKDPFSPVHVNGLMLNGGCTGKYYNNQIWDGAGMGLNSFGNGDVYLYNNLIVRPGGDGIFIDERGPVTPGTGTHTHNNTIITPGRDGIRMYSRNSVGNTFVNNLIVQPGSLDTNYYNKNQYLYIIDDKVDYSQSNNLFIAHIGSAL